MLVCETMPTICEYSCSHMVKPYPKCQAGYLVQRPCRVAVSAHHLMRDVCAVRMICRAGSHHRLSSLSGMSHHMMLQAMAPVGVCIVQFFSKYVATATYLHGCT